MGPRSIIRGLQRLFRRNEAEQDLNDEVAYYLEQSTMAHMARGLSRPDAERQARLEFGGIEAAKEGVRAAGWDGVVDSLARDVGYGIRALRRNPAFTAVAVLTLALGIGANAAMFTVVNAVMLRALPYRDAGRLALIWTDDFRRGLHQEGTAYRTITNWRAENRSFADVAYFSTQRTAAMSNNPSNTRERTRNGLVSANLFDVLGVSPAIGRPISREDEDTRAPVVVISHAFWQRYFGGASDVLSKTVTTEDPGRGGVGALTVIGVMPAGFYFPDKQTEIWTPATTYWRFNRESIERFPQWARRWTAVARLKSDVSLDAARADLGQIGRRLDATYRSDIPDFPGFSSTVMPILDTIAGKSLQSALLILLGAVGLVLLIACANVANLLLARGAARQREFAIRRALGAGRARLIRQLVVESLVLASIGGVVGLLLAAAGTRVLAVVAAARVPRIEEIAIDGRVLMFSLAITVLAGLLFGVAPAFRVSGGRLNPMLKDADGAQHHRARSLLIVAECSLAIVLLAGAGLLLKSLGRLGGIDPGFDPRGVLTMRLEFPPEAPPRPEDRTQTSPTESARAHAREQVMSELMARVGAVPGVSRVGFTDDMFIAGQGHASITIPGRDSLPAGELAEATATPGFFAALRVPLRRGRYLTRADAATKIQALWTGLNTGMSLAEKERLAVPEPVVVNEAFVRRFFPTVDPIAKRFCIDPTNKTYWYVIVGVIGDMHRGGLERAAIPEYFGPYFPWPNGRADLLVRVQGDPLSVAPTVRRIVAEAIPNIIISNVSTADRQLADFSATRRFQTGLLTAFAVLALVLAAIGIYGVVHYAVVERTREIGIRIAVGATPREVMRFVIGRGVRMPMLGIALGLGLALGATRLLSRLLFGVGSTDPSTFASVGAVLALVTVAACYVPARKATRTDPVSALRRD